MPSLLEGMDLTPTCRHKVPLTLKGVGIISFLSSRKDKGYIFSDIKVHSDLVLGTLVLNPLTPLMLVI